MFFGFNVNDDGVKEITPTLFDFATKEARRVFFVSQYNTCVKESFRISPLHVKGCANLHELFVKKIKHLSKDKTLPMCENSKKILYHFFAGDFVSMQKFCFARVENDAAKLAQMIYAKEDKGLCFEADMLFCNYVYEKIQKRHKDKKVVFKNGIITVFKDGREIIGVMPCFKYVNMQECEKADDEIKRAYALLDGGNLEKLFIAYPRNDEFTRHIVVKKSHNDTKSRLTLVPYSISHRVVCKSQKTNLKKGD